jgi:putative flippase GtrA
VLVAVTLVWTFMVLGLAPLVAKVIATPIALVWNYFGRRLFVFHPEMPSGIWQMSTRALSATRSIFLVLEPPANG